MTLKDQLHAALANVAPFSGGDRLVEVDDGTRHLECRLLALDTLGCAITRLALRADSLTGLSAQQLKETAEKLSARLTYLLEPISPIETDAHGCVVGLLQLNLGDADRTSDASCLNAWASRLPCRHTPPGRRCR
jgi:hypothetical protein